MEGCLIKLQELLESLPVVEKKAAILLLDSPRQFIEMQLDEVCYASGASASSVVRLAKRLGCTGFKDLCRAVSVDLALQNSNKPQSESNSGNYDDICRSVCYTNIKAIESTLALIDYEQFAKAVEAIVAAKRVDLYGAASSENVCRDGYLKFTRLKKISVTADNPHCQILSASTLQPGDVAILISYSGVTHDTIETMKAVKKTGATAISITKYGETPLSEMADIKLYVNNSENSYRVSATGSRIGHLTMIDMLFTVVYSIINKDVEEHISQTQSMLNRKMMGIR